MKKELFNLKMEQYRQGYLDAAVFPRKQKKKVRAKYILLAVKLRYVYDSFESIYNLTN